MFARTTWALFDAIMAECREEGQRLGLDPNWLFELHCQQIIYARTRKHRGQGLRRIRNPYHVGI